MMYLLIGFILFGYGACQEDGSVSNSGKSASRLITECACDDSIAGHRTLSLGFLQEQFRHIPMKSHE